MIDFSRLKGDLGTYDRNIDYDFNYRLYIDEENNPENKEYYPTEYEKRKQYILNEWWGKDMMGKRHIKIINIWNNIQLNGHGLELGFNWGGSVKWLLDRYSNIKIDGIDFSPYMQGNVDVFKEVYGDRVHDFWEASINKIDKPDNYYDFINSCSIFEHLPDCIYYDTIKECYRTLKPNGYLGVYLDTGRAEGTHIRMDSLAVTKADLLSVGFIQINNYLFKK
jgi:cyclopropane fatty-acyl-phospholipid synthase-like methyltransferase